MKDRKDRLGQANDVDDILGHPWFKDIDMKDLLAKKIKSPYLPKIENQGDLQNFDEEVTAQSMEESILPEEAVNTIIDSKDAFKDFGPMMSNVVGK